MGKMAGGQEGTGSQNCFILKKKKNIQVTNPIIVKDTLKIKTKIAFWIK